MAPITWIAAKVAQVLEAENVLYLADDDQHAQALAATLRAMLPDKTIIFVPSSDALPGDVAPASPANVGMRVAALHALRMAERAGDGVKLACVASGEAAARLYPPPEAFDVALPCITLGDALTIERLSEIIAEVGYYADDRVDEPGEMAVRGEIVDIFPADAGLPARIEIGDGIVVSIRAYDPATQRSVEELEALEIGRAAEPPVESATSILAHVPSGAILLSEKADKRRRRFLRLASDVAAGKSGRIEVVPASWTVWRLS